MKVRARIDTITDLLLGAMYADRRFEAADRSALQRMLCDLLVRPELPPELERRICDFTPEGFDLSATAREFRRDPPMRPRRMLELVAELCVADGELDLDEDAYLHRLARALELPPTEYEDILLDYEMVDLARTADDLRTLPAPLPPA